MKKIFAGLLVCILMCNSLYGVQTVHAADNMAIVNVAKGELGVSGQPNKYTYWYGSIGGTYAYAWCHAFVSWCAEQAGAGNLVPKTASCYYGAKWFKDNGLWKDRSSGYVPQAGDIIYFDWDCNGGWDHVGIVNYVSNGRVYIIDGNSGGYPGAVKGHNYSLTHSEILGYGTPLYEETTPPINPQISKNQYWYDVSDTIEITAHADYATNYYMSMYKDGERIKSQDVNGGKFTMSASEYGLGDYKAYFSCWNSLGTVDTPWIEFSVVGAAGYSDVYTDQKYYEIGDTITITVDTICADGQTIGIDNVDQDQRVYTQTVSNPFQLQASTLGVGNYSAYYTVYNGSGGVDTERVYFTIMEEIPMPEYSAIWASKTIYDSNETITISANTKYADGLWIGIDEIGGERRITKNVDSPYSIAASELGIGQYSAYFTVYNSSGSIDTKRVEFAIAEPCDLGESFLAKIKNQTGTMYLTNVDGNVEGEVLRCHDNQIWRFEKQSDDSYVITNKLDNSVMEVKSDEGIFDGVNVQLGEKKDIETQKFYVYEVFGAYYIKLADHDFVFDMDQKSYNLQMWNCGANWENQEFSIIKVQENVGEHKYVLDIEQKSSCTEKGYKKYVCEVCETSYEEEIPKLEHDYSKQWTVDVEPTYTSEGSKSRHCVNCDAKTDITTIPPLSQDNTENQIGQLVMANVSGKTGDIVKVPISIQKNSGIIAIQCKLRYDSSKVKLVKVESSDMLDSSALSTDYTKNPYVLSLGDDLATENITATGELVTAYFELLSDFKEGSTEIELIFEEAYDKDLNEVTFESCTGKIEIKDYIPGDVNGDGQVKLNDAILLRRYVAGWDVTIDTLAGDVNGDGQVKLNDAILLRRYVAGWDVTLK